VKMIVTVFIPAGGPAFTATSLNADTFKATLTQAVADHPDMAPIEITSFTVSDPVVTSYSGTSLTGAAQHIAGSSVLPAFVALVAALAGRQFFA